jgi:hypothetical protein
VFHSGGRITGSQLQPFISALTGKGLKYVFGLSAGSTALYRDLQARGRRDNYNKRRFAGATLMFLDKCC